MTSLAQVPSRKVMELQTSFERESTSETSVVVKGFASVERVDRQNEVADPFAFNIPTFMNDGTVLVNHSMWKDERGNPVRAGRITKLFPAYISGEKGDNWEISDIASKSVQTDFPKSKVPELSIGDRGLFAFAEITQPEVARKVSEGEYGGFSWRGLTRKSLAMDGGKIVNRFTEIDLWEISIVNVPVSNQSTLISSKSLTGDENLCVTCVLLSKNDYPTEEAIKSFLSSHNMSFDNLRDAGDHICAVQCAPEKYDVIKSVKVKLGGAEILMSPNNQVPADLDVKKTSSQKGGKKMKLFSFSADTLNQLFGDNYSTATKSVSIGDTEVEVVEISAKPREVEDKQDVSALIEAKFAEFVAANSKDESKLEELNTKLADLQSRHDELHTKYQEFTASAKASAEAEAAAQAETEETESEVLESVKSLLVQFAQKQQEQEKTMSDVVSAVTKLASVTPADKARVDASKSVGATENDWDSYFKKQFGG